MKVLLPWLEASMAIETEDCIEWPFGKHKGYGQFQWEGKTWNAARYVCIQAHGNPPPGKNECRHLCGNPACVNRHHLCWGSHKENMQDKLMHGTHQFGERNHRAKLTDAQVSRVRKLRSTATAASVASMLGVSESCITSIWRGERRKGAACAST